MVSWYIVTYFLNVFEIVPVAPIITGITFVYYYYYYYYCGGGEKQFALQAFLCSDIPN